MNRIEALEALGFSAGSSPTADEIRKAFKKKSAKLHPDICKDPDAEEKFKKLSEAHEYLKNPPPEPTFGNKSNGVPQQNFYDFFRNNVGFNSSVMFIQPDPLKIRLPLTFKESVIGAKKIIKFPRKAPCADCLGVGTKSTSEKCNYCGGQGFQINQRGQIMFHSDCHSCKGTGFVQEECLPCQGKGSEIKENKVEINVPGGVVNGSIIRLRGVGNIEVQNGRAITGEVHLIAKVEKEVGLSIQGQNVISTIDISLIAALKGSQVEVKTVLGNKEVEIKPKTKHKDQITLPKLGVDLQGDQVVTINVHYPNDVSDLIKILEEENQDGNEHPVQQ